MIGVAAKERVRYVPAVEEALPLGARDMVAIAFRHRLKIVLALSLPPLLALALVVWLPEAYRAESDILVKTGREYLAQTDPESSGFTAPSSTKQEGINSEIALLTSRTVAEAAIAAIGLDQLYPDIVEQPPSSGSVLDAAVLQFEKDLAVDPVKMSNVIATSFDAPTPQRAKQVLDTVIRIYIDKHTQIFAGRRTEGYRDSIEKTMQEIRALEQHRSSIKLANALYDVPAQLQAMIAQRVDAQTKLEDAVTRRTKLDARLKYLARARDQAAATTVATSTEKNEEAMHAREALIDLRQQEAALSARLGDANPDLQRVRSQLVTIQRAADTTNGQRSNTTTTASVLRQQIDQEMMMAGADLATMKSEVDRAGIALAARDAELARLERADLDLRSTVLQIDIITDNLKAMQGRYEQARADEQTDIARQVSVVQVAQSIASEKPVQPKRLVLGLGGVFGGILAAGLTAVLAITLNKTAVTEDAAERRLGLPVLAAIPVRKGRRNATFKLS